MRIRKTVILDQETVEMVNKWSKRDGRSFVKELEMIIGMGINEALKVEERDKRLNYSLSFGSPKKGATVVL